MIEFIQQPWPWWFSGLIITSIMFMLVYYGKSFGFSSNLRTLCAVAGVGKWVKFFDFNWKSQIWNIVFLIGAAIGGLIAKTFLVSDEPILLSMSTITDLSSLGIQFSNLPQPDEIFSINSALSFKGFSILAISGLLVGFGSRYAGGCTSGHAISGLSSLQLPSLISVIGFFIGGLLMTHFILPLVL